MLLLAHGLMHAALGAAWAKAHAPSQVAGGTDKRWWPLCAALYLDVLTLAPLVAYQLRLWPAYVFAYAFDPLLVPALYQAVPYACLAVLVALPACLAASYVLALGAAASGRPWLATLQLLACVLAACGVLVRHREDWLTIADFGHFWQGGGTPIWQHVHAQALAAGYAVAALSLCWRWARAAAAVRRARRRRPDQPAV